MLLTSKQLEKIHQKYFMIEIKMSVLVIMFIFFTLNCCLTKFMLQPDFSPLALFYRIQALFSLPLITFLSMVVTPVNGYYLGFSLLVGFYYIGKIKNKYFDLIYLIYLVLYFYFIFRKVPISSSLFNAIYGIMKPLIR